MLEYRPLGDQGIQILFGNCIDENTVNRILTFIEILKGKEIHAIVEWVPAYTTLTVFYNPYLIEYQELVNQLLKVEEELYQHNKSLNHTFPNCTSPNHSSLRTNVSIEQILEIPTFYGEEHGPDLEDVASFHNITTDDVIAIHSARIYLVHMLGFTPGFPYLGGLSLQIATPRLDKPRLRVKAGSVGIAGKQTGIYSVDSPGGWRIIGHTPIDLYNPYRESPFLLKSGDYIRFTPIDRETYHTLLGDKL
ncbi:hypothetical protein BHU72_09405 [Desulfuribacillus stibiiarsenatis]|uniref:Carboxyltransferase domain-containing protein n=1 Tax=Desulfuribacillus stibiiarsenatis TaxID=1390249 RepID=A0A1E5L352_9FIRM|nr:5-oxoprolinase subunit PxpB [Desulfuribacillus stibiiarsenatis]OEH84514.1 hypothetical protein BHU72_09405 [Desulfuribacillus stibiiarsenatis]